MWGTFLTAATCKTISTCTRIIVLSTGFSVVACVDVHFLHTNISYRIPMLQDKCHCPLQCYVPEMSGMRTGLLADRDPQNISNPRKVADADGPGSQSLMGTGL